MNPASTPMFYTRLRPERARLRRVARNVPGGGEEGKRRDWIARPDDDGRPFEPERAVFDEPTGACGCCGLGALADHKNRVYVLFRSAFEIGAGWPRIVGRAADSP